MEELPQLLESIIGEYSLQDYPMDRSNGSNQNNTTRKKFFLTKKNPPQQMQNSLYPYHKVYQLHRKCCIIFREPNTHRIDNLLELLTEAKKDAPHLTDDQVKVIDIIDDKKNRYLGLEWKEETLIPQGYFIQKPNNKSP